MSTPREIDVDPATITRLEAREDRDYQITRGYLPGDIAEHIRDVNTDS